MLRMKSTKHARQIQSTSGENVSRLDITGLLASQSWTVDYTKLVGNAETGDGVTDNRNFPGLQTAWARFSLQQPSGPLTGQQRFRVRAAASTTTGNPKIQVEVWQNGTQQLSFPAVPLGTTFATFSFDWDANALQGTGPVEVRLILRDGTPDAGYMRIDAIDWLARWRQETSGGTGGTNEWPAASRIITVTNTAQFQSALSAALPGDHIVLQDGTYAGDFALARDGTPDARIVIRAQNKLGAILTGNLALNGRWGWVWGLRFQGAAAGITVSGQDNVIRRCKFTDSERPAVINLFATGKRTTVEYCAITVAPFDPGLTTRTTRHGIIVQSSDTTMHIGVIIRRCHFHDFPPDPPLSRQYCNPVGFSTTERGANFDCEGILEYCRFDDIRRTNDECVMVKTRRAIIRFNTFINTSYVGLRQGWASEVYGNWFEDAPGDLRVYNADHRIIGNKFVNSRGIWVASGTIEPYLATNGWPYAYRCLFAYNQGNILVGAFDHPYVPTDNRIEAHTGQIQLRRHSGTVIRETSDAEPIEPIKLETSQVGPDGV